MNESVSIAILAGGQSTRMGQDKSFVELRGKPLIAHVIKRVSELSLPVIIIANRLDAYQVFGLPLFTDVLPDRSSLAGLYSAIHYSRTEYTLCVACDMPFLNVSILEKLISLRAGYDAVVPIINQHPQGLHAVYRKTCLEPMLREIQQNHLRIRDFYALVKTHYVDETVLRQYDPELKSFMNVNTPEILEKLKSGAGPSA
ncbi:MAG: NTP transferase domain-containing protein [Anaerolineaceae bacterium]|nr:NTP transferase domain-containing protein [Anaerolineaceae bacterium]